MTDEDEAFAALEKSLGWRKRQIEQSQEQDPKRNEVLEEVAEEFDKMKPLGDTAASFACFVRNMKR